MIHQRKILSSNRVIDIFDDVFDCNETFAFMLFFEKSHYQLTGRATPLIEQNHYPFTWQSGYSDDDIENLGFFNSVNFAPLEKFLEERKLVRSWVNCFIPSITVGCHVDEVKKDFSKSLLYYGNLDWKKEQGGETLFYNNKMVPEEVVECKYNRVLIYDADIPHKPLQHIHFDSSSPYRFTFVSLFTRN